MDARVSPATIFNTQPDDIFVIRTIGNLVPPYGSPDGKDATAAVLEYGVRFLNIERIIVFGHSQCGGVRASMEGATSLPHVEAWISWLGDKSEEASNMLTDGEREVRARAREQAAVRNSLENLKTYPWIRRRLEEGSLQATAWYFDMVQGSLWAFEPSSGKFERIDGQEDEPTSPE